MYIVSILMVIFVVVNYFFSYKLYEEPKNKNYFSNVKEINFEKERYIAPNPKYVALISILLGIMLGIYVALCSYYKTNAWVVISIIFVLFICYLIEITRKITIKDGKLILTKAFSRKYEIEGRNIKGAYIYSYNKKFLKKHALTTKLVIVTKTNKLKKFILSSLDNKAVLNMMKENLGVTEYKMFICKGNTKEQ